MADPEVVEAFGPIEVAQVKMVVHDLQASQVDASPAQSVIMAETLMRFLQSLQTLKTYEREKSKIIQASQEPAAQEPKESPTTSKPPSSQIPELLVPQENKYSFVDKRDYSDYLRKLENVNYNRLETIKQYVQEIKAH